MATQFSLITTSLEKIFDDDGQLYYQENFCPEIDIENLISEIKWQQDHIKMFGKVHPLPRLTAFLGDPGISYEYSKIRMQATAWTPSVLELKSKLHRELGHQFNSVLINYYRNGADHMSYHSDDELELGENPIIASLSFGASRKFSIKHKYNHSKNNFEINLNDKSLLLMSGELQHFWVHKIHKKLSEHNPRINLTFRQIKNFI